MIYKLPSKIYLLNLNQLTNLDHGRRKHGEKQQVNSINQKQQVLYETKNFMSVMPFKERIYPQETTITATTTMPKEALLIKDKHKSVATMPGDTNRNEINKKLTSSIFNAVMQSTAARNSSLLFSGKIFLALFFFGIFYLKNLWIF